MLRIGLIKERKIPADNRVALSPQQCVHIEAQYKIKILVEPSEIRCYSDEEYQIAGIEVNDDLSSCDILLGIKEVPVDKLISGKTYFFFSHTKKKQAHNRDLMHALINKHIRMIDYECLIHEDEQRILGFGLYAGIVGAHNGLLAYGKKFRLYNLPEAYKVKNYETLIHAYDNVRLPNIKIVMTGSGKVAAGILDVMARLDVESVEPSDFLTHEYDYPVYTHLRGNDLYARKDNGLFYRDDFHAHPEIYKCLFSSYVNQADILMNGIYWDHHIARLFEREDVARKDWRIKVIADISCDINGGVPVTVKATTIEQPFYGIDRITLQVAEPLQNTNDIIDMMTVDNLPNELPRDASEYFGQHFEKYILTELLSGSSEIIERATICRDGKLTKDYEYLADYAY
jgi:alanine dehydrogenase